VSVMAMFLFVEYLWREISLDMRVYMVVCAAVVFVANVAWMNGKGETK